MPASILPTVMIHEVLKSIHIVIWQTWKPILPKCEFSFPLNISWIRKCSSGQKMPFWERWASWGGVLASQNRLSAGICDVACEGGPSVLPFATKTWVWGTHNRCAGNRALLGVWHIDKLYALSQGPLPSPGKQRLKQIQTPIQRVLSEGSESWAPTETGSGTEGHSVLWEVLTGDTGTALSTSLWDWGQPKWRQTCTQTHKG